MQRTRKRMTGLALAASMGTLPLLAGGALVAHAEADSNFTLEVQPYDSCTAPAEVTATLSAAGMYKVDRAAGDTAQSNTYGRPAGAVLTYPVIRGADPVQVTVTPMSDDGGTAVGESKSVTISALRPDARFDTLTIDPSDWQTVTGKVSGSRKVDHVTTMGTEVIENVPVTTDQPFTYKLPRPLAPGESASFAAQSCVASGNSYIAAVSRPQEIPATIRQFVVSRADGLIGVMVEGEEVVVTFTINGTEHVVPAVDGVAVFSPNPFPMNGEEVTATAVNRYGSDTQTQRAEDVTPPSIESASYELANNLMTGVTEPNVTVDVKDAAGNPIATATSDANGRFAMSLPRVPEVTQTYSLTARDAAGNVSNPYPVDVVVPPEPTDTPEPSSTVAPTEGSESAPPTAPTASSITITDPPATGPVATQTTTAPPAHSPATASPADRADPAGDDLPATGAGTGLAIVGALGLLAAGLGAAALGLRKARRHS